MSEKKQPVDLGLLEEDDEFEEFPAEGASRGRRGTGGQDATGRGLRGGLPRPGPAWAGGSGGGTGAPCAPALPAGARASAAAAGAPLCCRSAEPG